MVLPSRTATLVVIDPMSMPAVSMDAGFLTLSRNWQ
jgi:N-acetylmuramoyl-L-alanine amidase